MLTTAAMFRQRAGRAARLFAMATLGVLGASPVGNSLAQDVHPADRPAEDPPFASLVSRSRDAAGIEPAAAVARAPILTANRGEVFWHADIEYVDSRIFNPKSGVYDNVRLRAYQGEGVDPSVPFVAPTISLLPGETFRLTLNNTLPADDPSCVDYDDVNTPHCFNSTNMHTHGLWVNPSGNSDNVLIRINPGVSFNYEYNVPLDHPAGTFWYHPHLHGSTALQVSSGMAGALIIHGRRLPTPDATGDVDTLLRDVNGSAFRERVVLLQQIPYACRDSSGNIKTGPSGEWVCDDGDVGAIEQYDQFGPPVWKASGRHTSINGRVLPTFNGAESGRIERWRLIHAGVRESIKLRFQKFDPRRSVKASATELAGASLEAQQKFVDDHCRGSAIAQFSLATDGLTRERLVEQSESVLQPGYREDLLMVFPEPGIYCMIDGEADDDDTVSQERNTRRMLGFVRVAEGSDEVGDSVEFMKRKLMESAAANMPGSVRERIVSDLDRNLGLASFLPHASLVDVEPDGYQSLGFRILNKWTPDNGRQTVFEIGDLADDLRGGITIIKSQPYDPDRIDRLLKLGDVDEWTLASFLGGHPFHIHVNPFQVIKVLDKDGNDVSGYEPDNDSPYARLRGAWKDTLFVTQDDAEPYQVIVRTRYERYIGDFVLHCHILDHEDQGMMQNVRIAIPDGKGGLASGHH